MNWIYYNNILFLKVSDGAKKTPELLFSPKCKPVQYITKKRSIPQNPASGLYLGTSSAISQVVGAIYGLIAEPVKGKIYKEK